MNVVQSALIPRNLPRMDHGSLRETVSRLERALQRLQALDELVPALAGVLDIRDVFERVSTIAKKVIPHDMMSLLLPGEDRKSLIVYAVAGNTIRFPEIVPLPEHYQALVATHWDHIIHGDMQLDPRERVTPPALAGYRGRLAVQVRMQSELGAALDFMSFQTDLYTAEDVLVARRIADHVALALSHQRLAEESRVAAALRQRSANIELLDVLLASVTDTGELREVIDRVSDIAQKVLPHDAMVLPVLLPDRTHVRFHVTKVPSGAKFPEVIEVPEHLRRSDWDSEVVDDLQAHPLHRDFAPAKIGYRSALRVPIRVEGQLAAGVGFFSFTPSFYKQDDIVIARRVADRLALSLMRERGIEAANRATEASERAARLESRVQSLVAELNAVTGYRWVIGQSEPWAKVLKQATQVAGTDTTVLLLGESGTGKEVVARFIHRASRQSGGPFVALNCAALPEPLLESELFGYERGAFTGALQAKPGQLEQAAGGVLFLDEVGEMTLPVQAKFLRVLQEREFQRLGGTRTLKANVRVVAATNRNLRHAINRGTFREDLYYRLHVFEIQLPPLRERRDDILPLSEAFLKEIAKGLGCPPAGISREARDGLLAYGWPGNVRELRNMLERAAILCEGGLITADHLTFMSGPAADTPERTAPPVAAARPAETSDLRVLERTTIERALQDARHNKSRAARILGLSRKQLYVRLRQHGLE
jgi:transcriptional regulator with GAF, ATPase, and Fis domain